MVDTAESTEVQPVDPNVFDFKAMFNKHNGDNQKIWDHDRSTSVGASEVFDCLRKVFFNKNAEKMGFEKDEDRSDSWGAMERGNIIEESFVVPVLEAQGPEGTNFMFGSGGQQTFVYGQNSATPDGLYTGCAPNALSLYGIEDLESDCFCVEIKSIDPRVKLDEEKHIHYGQVQQQMAIIRRMTEWRPMYTVILYVNASFLDDIKVFVVRYEPNSWKSAKTRADMILNASEPKELMAEGKITDSCEFCPWQGECAIATQGRIPTRELGKKESLPDETNAQLSDLARRIKELTKLSKDSDEEKKELTEEVRNILEDNDVRKVKGDDFSVSWSFTAGRKSLDKEALTEAGIDLEPFMKEGHGFDRMTVNYKPVAAE